MFAMPIYNRNSESSLVSNDESGGEKEQLDELRAKRTKGNVTTDNVFGATGALDPNPPPKARPRAHL